MMPSPPNSCAMLPALIVNGERQPQSPAKPAAMLLHHPKGPYTTAHVTAGLCAEAWQQHMVRLARAALRLHQQDAGSFQRVIKALQDGEYAELQLQQLLDARLRAELAALAAADATRMAVTILMCDPPASSESCTQDRALGVVIHAMALPPAPAVPPDVETAVVGHGRRLPEVKHSQWVVDRQQLAPNMSEAAAEGILCDADGRLLEGMITNLFIVADDGSGGVILTTAAEADGVLPGIMRAYVLRACAALGIPVVQQAPHWSSHACWQEAFLTNSLRGLQPLRRIVCRQPGLCGECPWVVSLPPRSRDSVLDRLRRQVQELLAVEAVHLQPLEQADARDHRTQLDDDET